MASCLACSLVLFITVEFRLSLEECFKKANVRRRELSSAAACFAASRRSRRDFEADCGGDPKMLLIVNEFRDVVLGHASVHRLALSRGPTLRGSTDLATSRKAALLASVTLEKLQYSKLRFTSKTRHLFQMQWLLIMDFLARPRFPWSEKNSTSR